MSKDATKRELRALGLALRVFRGERSRASLAKASRIQRWRIAAYERGEMAPEPETLSRIAEVSGTSPTAIRSLAELLSLAPELLDRGIDPEGIETVERAVRLARSLCSLKPLSRTLKPLRTESDMTRKASALWDRLKPYSAAQRRTLIREVPEFHERTLSVFLCNESIEAAAEDPGEALELAKLAELIAQFATGSDSSRASLRAFCSFHVSSALRGSGDLSAAYETLERAQALWKPDQESRENQPLAHARVLGLTASLFRDQGRLDEALDLLDQALSAPSEGEAKYLHLNRANTLGKIGRHEEAVEALWQALPHIDPEREPRLLWSQRFNLAVNLVHLGRYEEAQQWMGDIRRLAPKGVSRTRIVWLEGTLAAGLGQTGDAEALFKSVRDEFVARKNALDAALVSLDLAVLYLPQGRTAEVKALAVEMVTIFREQKVHREALAAVRLFREAAERERATVELARRLAEYLRRARFEEGVRFVGQG